VLEELHRQHIEPVRSRAITMSTGVDEHGLQAFACAETLKWSIPNILANHVSEVAVPDTVRSFGDVATHETAAIACAVHFVEYVKVNLPLRFAGVL
jgi:hypothetical protein